MSTVPVFAPTGELGDIPVERVADARKAGFKVGVHMQSADGQDGVIPADRTAEAVKAGMKIVPIQDQPSQHPGFLSALGSDLGGMMGKLLPPTTKEELLARVKAFAGGDPREQVQSVIDRANAGYGPAYAALAPTAEQLGVNVKGMEQSAQQGDVGGVAGHAASVPTAMAGSALLSQLPLGRMAKAAGGAAVGGAERLPIVGPVAKGAIRGALKSWRASAPAADIEIPPSKVSTTPPESVSKSSQLQQAKALQNVPASQAAATPATLDKSTILSRLSQIAQQIQAQGNVPAPSGQPLRVAGQAVPADTNLASALQRSLPSTPAEPPPAYTGSQEYAGKVSKARGMKAYAAQQAESLPQARVEGKIMQVLRKEGTGLSIGKDRLMDSPQLRGVDPELVQKAVTHLRDQGKIWHEQTGGGAHPESYSVALKTR